MKTIMLAVSDCSLAVDTFYQENAKATIVFLHGGPGGRAAHICEYPLVKALGNTYNMVFFDQRGGGRSKYDLTKGIEKQTVVEDVQAVVKYAKAEFKTEVYISGISYGGALALMYLEQYEQEVKGAIIACPVLMTIEYEGNLSPWISGVKAAIPILPKSLQAAALKMEGTKDSIMELLSSRAFGDFILSNKQPIPGLEVVWYYYAMKNWYLKGFDLRELISKIKAPVLILQGMEDEICQEFLLTDAVNQAKNPNIVYHRLSPCTHNVFGDMQEKAKLLIDSFLREI